MNPGVRRLLPWLPLALALVWSAVVLATGVTTQSWQPGYDLSVYRHGAEDLLAGRDLYERVTDRGHYFVYPPLAAVLFVPLLLLPTAGPGAVGVDLVVWDVLLVVALVLGGGRLLRGAGVPARLVPTALALVVVSDPFREALVLGQVSPLVVLALVGGVVLAARSPWGGAVLAGLAGAVKVTPALVVALGVHRRWRRFALLTVGVGLVLTLLGALASPPAWSAYFGGLLWDSSRVAAPGTTSNNSLAGGFAHLGVPDGAATALGAVGTLVLLVWFLRRAGSVGAFEAGLAVSLLTCLGSPVTWSHHALAAPLAAVWWLSTREVRDGSRGAVVLAAVVLLVWILPVLQWGSVLGGTAGGVLAATRPLSVVFLVLLCGGRSVRR
ncbi:glycosyltransferase family 87 protein [Kineococcus gynurae]|uniref:Glycosyltransferase family 87 protein n=1 Tax=Kineococcus gynurae TaxID=452979 RepID=A0ABV5LRG7_9ACTN